MDNIYAKDPTLIGHFVFENGYCHDKVGRVPSVEVSGLIAGKKTLAKKVDGTYAEVSLPVFAHLCPPRFTCRSRFLINAFGGASDGIFQCNQNGAVNGYFQGVNTSGDALSYIGTSGWNICTGSAKIKLGRWNELVTTFDGTYHSFYVNGVLADRKATVAMVNSGTNCAFIGKYASSKINGLVESVEVWNRAKPLSELQREYQIWRGPALTKSFLSTVLTPVTSIDTLSPTAISSVEALGTPNAIQLLTVTAPPSISYSGAVGTPNAILLRTGVFPSSVVYTGAVGTPNVLNLLSRIAPSGIASSESFGTLNILNLLTIIGGSGIASLGVVGTPNLEGIDYLGASSITSLETFGSPNATQISRLIPSSIASQAGVGTPGLWKIIFGSADIYVKHDFYSTGTLGISGSVDSYISHLLESSGLLGISGSVDVTLLKFLLDTSFLVSQDVTALAACLLTGANTEYTSYPFNSFCVYQGKVYAAGPTGLFLLGGDHDVSSDISATLETAPDDFGVTNLKGIAEVVIGMKDGPAQVSHKFNDGYTIEQNIAKAEEFKNRRTQPGKGVVQRYWTTRITNKLGSPVNIDIIEFNLASKKRKINQ